MLFICILLPILESLMNLVCSGIEVLRSKCNVKIAENNNKIEKIHLEGNKSSVGQIGFQYTPEEDDDYEDDN